MSEFITREVNCETGEVVDRPMTEEEITKHKIFLQQANDGFKEKTN